MRKFLFTTAIITLLAGVAQAETIKTSVNGMVCSFCATGIEKTFRATPAVDDVQVDLDSKMVTITTKSSQKVDDATITKLITDAGYTVTNIAREK